MPDYRLKTLEGTEWHFNLNQSLSEIVAGINGDGYLLVAAHKWEGNRQTPSKETTIYRHAISSITSG
jgi:hypothetical protein